MKKTIRTWLLPVLMLGSGLGIFAQDPTTPAPTPAYDQEYVKAIFSDHYEQFAKFQEEYDDWNDNKTEKTIITPFNDPTDRVLKIDKIVNGSVAQIALGDCNWNDMDMLHLDIYSPGNNQGIGEFDFSLVSGWGSGVGEAGVWIDITGQNKHGEWISVDVPMSTFRNAGVNLSQVNILRLRRGSKGSSGQLLYVDNVFGYKTGNSGNDNSYVSIDPNDPGDQSATVPHCKAPVPAHEPEFVRGILSNYYECGSFELGYSDWLGGGAAVPEKVLISPYADDPSYEILKIDNLYSNNQAQFSLGTCNLSEFDMLHLDIYSPGDNKGIGEFDFGLIYAWSGNNHVSADIWLNITEENLHGRWISIDIPLSVFADKGVNLRDINILRLRRGSKGSGGTLLYVDNIYAYKTDGVIINPPTSVPTFTLTAANVKSIFCEQYEEADYQERLGIWDVSGDATLDDPYMDNKMNYGQNADQDRVFVEIVPGNKTIQLTNWNDYPFKIHKTSETMDLSDMDYLHISAYLMSNLGADNKGATMTFFMHDNEGQKIDNPAMVAGVDMKPGEWVSISIPLCYYRDHLDLENAYVLRPRLGGYTSMNVYIDNIFAYKGEPFAGTQVASDCTDGPGPDPDGPIQDSSDGVLPDRNCTFLGINLASASGGDNPGTLGTNYRYPRLEDLYYFNAKGIKLIRLPFRWKRIQRELNGPLTEADITEMKKVVKEAERLGQWVMLDMHDFCEYSRNDTLYEIGVAGYRTWRSSINGWGSWQASDRIEITKEHYADVWGKLADAFSDCSNIWGYDLMNEPKSLDMEVLKGNYQAAIDEIRKRDMEAAIVIEGKNYASSKDWPSISDGLKDLTDPANKIIYQAHTYFDSNSSGTYQSSYDSEVRNPEVYKERLDPFINWCKDNNKVGMIGEFGVPYNGATGGDERYMTLIDNVFQYLKEHNMTATYWCGGAFYESYHLTVQPTDNYTTEKSTMKVMEKYTRNYNAKCATSINETEADKDTQVLVYPNPVIDNITIQSVYGIQKAGIYNMLGQLVMEEDGNDRTLHTISLNGLSEGNYLIKIQLDNGSVTRKVIKL
ncbi:MAG: cellulase family glycosylhydrolase [Candidatus Azobacteroides sp.]|nr:cellulase family glycosylhydrolase [Candidatus Azobacteroides sp.]